MNYLSMDEVAVADRVQLARWIRFLKSPGLGAIGQDDFDEVMIQERDLLIVIMNRFQADGGMTPEISKLIGWSE